MEHIRTFQNQSGIKRLKYFTKNIYIQHFLILKSAMKLKENCLVLLTKMEPKLLGHLCAMISANGIETFSHSLYIDAQKIRTPKGLDWIRSKYPSLSSNELMQEMQAIRALHCTLWSEGVRELVSAEDSDVKFIISDHPVTIYNYACPPDNEQCLYPNDPDIALKGSQTIFPLNKNRCLILTNLEYAKDPDNSNPLEKRTNSIKTRQSMVNTIEFINKRKLTSDEVEKINYIIKSRSNESIASGRLEWLDINNKNSYIWSELRHTTLPPSDELYRYGGEMYASYENGESYYQDSFGRTNPQNKYLLKNVDEKNLNVMMIAVVGVAKNINNVVCH